MTRLVVRNGRLEDDGALVHVVCEDGELTAVGDSPVDGDVVVDAEGGLLSRPFADPHLHLCKVETVEIAGDGVLAQYAGVGMAGASAAIEAASRVKETYRADEIAAKAKRVLLRGLANGVTRVQAFADTDTKAGLEGVKGVLRARDDLTSVVDTRVVAFPQDGVMKDPAAEDLVRQGVELGADVVGGIPWIEDTEGEAREHIRRMGAIARRYDRRVAMLVDDAGDPQLRTTIHLAEWMLAEQWIGKATACHARALGVYPTPAVARAASLARRVGLAFVCDPHTGALHLPVQQLQAHGVTVALGQDDVADAYYPYGQHSMLEVAFLASHILRMLSKADARTLLRMITADGAAAMGATHDPLTTGTAAELLVLHGPNAREVIRYHRPPRAVITDGEIIAEDGVLAGRLAGALEAS